MKSKLFCKIYKLTALLTINVFMIYSASAQDITAINFNGDILGKVIPDGKVISSENKVLGSVNADSLVVDKKDNIIGGTVPQGIAIGNDAKVLGKVNSDGTIRSASGQILGKALPSGLVINEQYDVIGQIVSPGLVYDDEGKISGRVTGDGSYSNLNGVKIGIITPDGYAYRKVGKDYVLDGRLISSKMVVSNNGNFIGSVVPGGQVSDFNSEVIGHIKADKFVYDNQNAIIGKLVNAGYAINENGEYMGLVSYNGIVVNAGKTIGKIRSDGRIINNSGAIVGAELSFASVAVDMQGRYLGRLNPEGDIVKENSPIGKIGARKFVFDKDGNIAGKIVYTGPVYDYKGDQVGHAVSNGSVILLNGSSIGYMIGEVAYDLSGEPLGAVLINRAVYENSGAFVGFCGISAKINYKGGVAKVSPLGYVWNNNGSIIGRAVPDSQFYASAGTIYAYSDINGQAAKISGGYDTVLGGGLVINSQEKIVAKSIDANVAVDYAGMSVGYPNLSNALLNKSLKQTGKILPDGSVTSFGGTNYMPKIGQAYKENLAVKFNGDFLGNINVDGQIISKDGAKVGNLLERGLVSDNSGIVVGSIMPYSGAKNDKCELLGVVSQQGVIFNNRSVFIGKALSNHAVINDGGVVLGSITSSSPIIDFSGKIIGYPDYRGIVYNFKGEQLGCLDNKGRLYSSVGEWIGGVVDYNSVIDFNGKITGFALFDGSIIDDKNSVSGYQQPNGNINNNTGITIGMLMSYKFAFDFNNNFMGYIDNQGKVLNNQHNGIGRVDFYGNIYSDQNLIGYALDDMYVYDNAGMIKGIINYNGQISDFSNQNIGKLDKGFVLSNGEVIARGNRDYNIRDAQKVIIGELRLNGEVVNNKGIVIGNIDDSGQIKNAAGVVIAQATPLQYYHKSVSTGIPAAYQNTILSNQTEAIVDDKGGISYIADDGILLNDKGNIVGKINSENEVVDTNGKVTGRINQLGEVINNTGKLVAYKNVVASPTPDPNPVDVIVDTQGKISGYVAENGNVIDASGSLIGKIDDAGIMKDTSNNVLGKANDKGEIINDKGDVIARKDKVSLKWANPKSTVVIVDNQGNITGEITPKGGWIDSEGKVIGQISDNDKLIDSEGDVIARINPKGEIVNNQGVVIGRKVIINSPDSNATPTDDTANEQVDVIVDNQGNITSRIIAKGLLVNSDGEIVGKISDDNKLIDNNGDIVAQINEKGEIVDEQGKVVGRKEQRYLPRIFRQLIDALTNSEGDPIGYITDNGVIIDDDGSVMGKIEDDTLIDYNGDILGEVNNKGEVIDSQGAVVARIKKIDVIDKENQNIMGQISASAKSKSGIEDFKNENPDMNRMVEAIIKSDNKYHQSLNIAITPDGEYLGDINANDEVVNEQGDVIAQVMPNGLVINQEGEIIGTADNSSNNDKEKPDKKTKSSPLMPVGNRGDGEAHGVGDGPTVNLGPGGGHGPGERYDPVRVQALNAAMLQRRAGIKVGQLKLKQSSSFDGYQDDFKPGPILSSWRVDMSEMILEGKPIPAVIARAIDTNHPAPVVAYVERNVYAEEGRNIVIPAGSRILGEFGSISGPTEATSDSARVQIAWKRLIRPDGSMFQLDAAETADAQGRMGALGYVDQQLLKKYTLPVLTSVLSSAAAYAMATDDNGNSNIETSRQQAANDARQNFLDDMQGIFDQILRDKTNVKAMTYVPNGTRIIIYPKKDLRIRTPERDKQESNEGGNFHGLIDKDVTQTSANVPPGAPTYGPGGPTSTLGNDGGGGNVVYSSDQLNLNSTGSGNTPLISTAPAQRQRIAPPPPPSYGTNYNGNVGQTDTSSSTPNDSGTVALF